jgi:hypothetical protein
MGRTRPLYLEMHNDATASYLRMQSMLQMHNSEHVLVLCLKAVPPRFESRSSCLHLLPVGISPDESGTGAYRRAVTLLTRWGATQAMPRDFRIDNYLGRRLPVLLPTCRASDIRPLLKLAVKIKKRSHALDLTP